MKVQPPDVDGCFLDMQAPIFFAGLNGAQKVVNEASDQIRLAGLGILLDLPTGFREMDVFDQRFKGSAAPDGKKISHNSLKEGALPTLDQLHEKFKGQFLSVVNAFSAAMGSSLRLEDIVVLTDQRARRMMFNIAEGKSGFPTLNDIPDGVKAKLLVSDYSHDDEDSASGSSGSKDGRVVNCAGVYAIAHWLFGCIKHPPTSGQFVLDLDSQRTVLGYWLIDGVRVRAGDLQVGATASRYFGGHDILNCTLTAQAMKYDGSPDSDCALINIVKEKCL